MEFTVFVFICNPAFGKHQMSDYALRSLLMADMGLRVLMSECEGFILKD